MLDFGHILESSLGLTFGGMLLKLLDKTCKSNCSDTQPVQTIVQPDTESEKEVSDYASDVTIMISYDHINNLPTNNNNM